MATNRDAYVTAYGGPQVDTPSYAMCNPTQGCFKDFNPFGAPTAGDPAKAKQMLQAAGVTTPVKITVVYRSPPDGRQGALGAEGDLGPGGLRRPARGPDDEVLRRRSGSRVRQP